MNAVHRALALLDDGKTEEAADTLRRMIARPADASDIEARACELQTDELELDDNLCFSDADDGCWVSAWVWVPREESETDKEA